MHECTHARTHAHQLTLHGFTTHVCTYHARTSRASKHVMSHALTHAGPQILPLNGTIPTSDSERTASTRHIHAHRHTHQLEAIQPRTGGRTRKPRCRRCSPGGRYLLAVAAAVVIALRIEAARQAEVADLDLLVERDEDVPRGEVAMNDVHPAQVAHALRGGAAATRKRSGHECWESARQSHIGTAEPIDDRLRNRFVGRRFEKAELPLTYIYDNPKPYI